SLGKRLEYRRFEMAGDNSKPVNGEGRLVLQYILCGRLRLYRTARSQERRRQNGVSDAKPRISTNRTSRRVQCVNVSAGIKISDCQRMVRAKIIKIEKT